MIESGVSDSISERPQRPGFEEQFAYTHTIEAPTESIHVSVIIPEKVRDSVPAFIAPGWSESRKVLKNCLKVAYDNGRHSFTLDFPRSGGEVRYQPAPPSEAIKSNTVLTVFDDLNIRKADVVGHSEAGIYVILAALQDPKRFRSIVLVNPAGTVGEESFQDLFKRQLEMVAKSTLRMGTDRKVSGGLLRYFTEGTEQSIFLKILLVH